jgi:hypothetical protein
MDHPLDPANKYLTLSSVVSSQNLNIFSGTVVLDQNGEAWVRMPDWFESINTNFSYQVTAIGKEAELYIAQEVTNNKFKIAGGKAGMKVSWELTAERRGLGLEPLEAEKLKPSNERGLYLNPGAYGQPIEKSIMFSNDPYVLEFLKQQHQNATSLKPKF